MALNVRSIMVDACGKMAYFFFIVAVIGLLLIVGHLIGW